MTIRLRQPQEAEPPSLTTRNRPAIWRSYEFEMITPMLGGGVEKGVVDEAMAVRASAIKGQVRYWWRFLRMSETDFNDSTTLFDDEARVWGKMHESTDKIGDNGQVKMRVANIVKKHAESYTDDAAQYALFPARKTQDRAALKLLQPSLTFTLEICVREELLTEIEQALEWWLTFGGLGARTRRGIGSVVPVGTNKLGSIGRQQILEFNKAQKDPSNHLYLAISNHSHENFKDAWIAAVTCLSSFRQATEGRAISRIPDRRNPDHTIPKFSRSFWPEPDGIRTLIPRPSRRHMPEHPAIGRYPRAAFGMPIITKFHSKDPDDPPQVEIKPEGYDRAASPVFLTAIPVANRYKAAALLVPAKHIYELSISIKSEQSSHRVDNWWDTASAGQIDPISNNNGHDALSAFINYFGAKAK